MLNIVLYFVINGAIISGAILLILDAINLARNHNSPYKETLRETSHSRINMENNTVTYYTLQKYQVENIKNCVGTIVSGSVTVISLFLEFMVNQDVELDLEKIIVFTFLSGVIIAIVILIARKIISFVIIKAMNAYAKRHGLVRKLTEDVEIDYE